MTLSTKLLVRFQIAITGVFLGNPQCISNFFIKLLRLQNITKILDTNILTKYNKVLSFITLFPGIFIGYTCIRLEPTNNMIVNVLSSAVVFYIIVMCGMIAFKFFCVSESSIEKVRHYSDINT